MSEPRIIASQSKEEAQRNIDRLFAVDVAVDAPIADDSEMREPSSRISESQLTPPISGDVLTDLPIDLLVDFPKERHPFKPYTQQEMESLTEDIIQNGVLQPALVRPHPSLRGSYEIVAGHNRRDAAKRAGYTTLPCIVRQLDDDEALLQMLSSNLKQRTGLSYREKAFAYRWQLEAMKRQGRRSDLWEDGTSRQDGAKSREGRTDEQMASGAADSARQILRYIRLTYLKDELLDAVDENKLPFIVGVTLSYLSTANQELVYNFFFEQRTYPITQNIADKLREMGDAGTLDEQALERDFLSPHVVRQLNSVKMPLKKWRNRIGPEATEKEVVTMCVSAVDVLLDCRDEYFNKDADAQTVVDAIKEAMDAKYGKKGGNKE